MRLDLSRQLVAWLKVVHELVHLGGILLCCFTTTLGLLFADLGCLLLLLVRLVLLVLL